MAIKLEDVEAMSVFERNKLLCEKWLPKVDYLDELGNDLNIHIQVCKLWDAQSLLGNYFHALEVLLCKAGDEQIELNRLISEEPSLYSLMHYRAGMFSIAALFVLLHYEESKRLRIIS